MTGRATHEAGTPAIAVEGLAVGYGERLAISEVSFEVDEGEHLAVAGPNGAGKSTLLKAIAGLLPLQRGRVRIFGHPPRDTSASPTSRSEARSTGDSRSPSPTSL